MLFLSLAEENDEDTSVVRALNSYRQLADRIRADADAKQYIDDLWNGFKHGKQEGAFNALCVPSGTGKTQLAFTLPVDKCACIYLNTGFRRADAPGRQAVYNAFAGYMGAFMNLLKKDYEEGKNLVQDDIQELRIFGFVRALLALLMKHPRLHLPADLARIRLTHDPRGEPVSKATKSDVNHLKNTWSVANGNKEIVFFIDEFTAISEESQQELAFLRRRLMDTKSCVIVASTDSGALHMSKRTAATPDSRGRINVPWVNLCTQLPPYVAKTDLVDAIGNCNNPRLKKLVELCIQSRPLFAETVADKLQQFIDEPNGNVVKLLELMREDLVSLLGSKEGSHSLEGCVGYVMAILQSGRALVGADEAQSRLFGDLNTKNWAYLINDQRARLSGNPQQPRVKAGGVQRDVFVPLSCKDPRPSFLMLLRAYTPLGDNLYYMGVNGVRATFTCTTFFPDPSEDFLLYLVLVGSVAFPGLYVSNNGQRSHRVTVASLFY